MVMESLTMIKGENKQKRALFLLPEPFPDCPSVCTVGQHI